MATGQAKEMQIANGRPVFVVGRHGRPQWHEVFENNPRLVRTRTLESQILVNGSGLRPYISEKTPTRWVWKRMRVVPGELYFTEAEKQFGLQHCGRIFIEPNTKVPEGNKAWRWERWQQVVDDDKSAALYLQCAPTSAGPWLDGVERIITPTFRLACAVLSFSRAFVGTEGGLHHAAAALKVPAVVLFSEFIGPDITGYEQHRNIRHANGMCGSRIPCQGCRDSMDAISVDEVSQALAEVAG